MKPYGLINRIMAFKAKRDYHLHRNSRKVASWWEDYSNPASRKTMKQKVKQEIEEL